MDTQEKYKRAWLVQSTIGLFLTTAGICMAIDAALVRQQSEHLLFWVLYGSISLIILNCGFCFIGGGVVNKCRYEISLEEAKKQV